MGMVTARGNGGKLRGDNNFRLLRIPGPLKPEFGICNA